VRGKGRIYARVGIALFLAAAVSAIYLTPARHWFTMAHARQLVDQLRGVWYGPFLLIGAYAIGCVLAVPATIFIVVSGIVWGWFLGGLYAIAGGCLGATLSYLVGRFLGSGLLKRLGKQGARVEKQLEHGGLRSMFLLRLIPLFPFALVNYGAGIAGMRLTDFFLGTLLGTAPAHFVMAYSADALANGSLTGPQAFVRILTVGLLLAALVIIPALLRKRVEAEIES
jgi:uncharacterized membrane protein YdjX (TVP38/TMEM64 family)